MGSPSVALHRLLALTFMFKPIKGLGTARDLFAKVSCVGHRPPWLIVLALALILAFIAVLIFALTFEFAPMVSVFTFALFASTVVVRWMCRWCILCH